ncbi:MAG: ATP-binding cassette domain-containing protein [Thermoleophilia bacterium]|nr:ATP-binding cassette domain-containing protein [Thermoleophilia bacterium]
MSHALRCEHLAVGYDGHAVVTDIALTLDPGQWLAVVGTNGSGKSTMLRTVAGLIPLIGGTLGVLGGAAGGRRASVSYLSQSHEQGFLLPLRARDVVRMGRWPVRGLVGRLRRDDESVVDEAMEALGISDLADTPLGALSGGQCQRVHLAQVVCRQADLLLLDEPTAGLDAGSRERYLRLMDSERDRGAAIVSATHDVREAARADLALLLAERVVACGPPDEVLTAAALSDTFGVIIAGSTGPVVIDPHHEHDHVHGPGTPRLLGRSRAHEQAHGRDGGGHQH